MMRVPRTKQGGSSRPLIVIVTVVDPRVDVTVNTSCRVSPLSSAWIAGLELVAV